MTSTALESREARDRTRIDWRIGIAAVFVTAALAQIIYVSLYAMPIPFWDQWDELNQQYQPWLAGSWHPSLLFMAHNEHRVLLTRLVGLLLFALNDHTFDNLVVAFANTFIYAAMWALAYALLARHVTRGRRLAILAFVIALGILPFDWENTLIGFQNQFYLMQIVAIVLFGIASYRPDSITTLVTLAILAVASLFTMASGVLALPVVCEIAVFRAWRGPCRRGFILPLIALTSIATAVGIAIIPHTAADTLFDARSPLEFVHALFTALMWPVTRYYAWKTVFAVVLWAPSVIWLWRFARTRKAGADELFAAGIASWVFLQCLAIAHSRGHGLVGVPSRYTDILALGLLANFWFALELVRGSVSTRRSVATGMVAVVAVLLAWVLCKGTHGDFSQMVLRRHFSRIETANVSRYFAGDPLPKLPAMDLDLPYPSATRLKHFLDTPDMRALLPPSLFPPSASRKAAPLSAWASRFQQSVQHLFHANTQHAVSMPVAFKPYTGVLPDVITNHECVLDGIDSHPAASIVSIAQRDAATFDGWIGNGHGHVPRQALLVLQGNPISYAAPITPGVDRPDVAKAWKRHGLADSGFHLMASPADVAPGRYTLYTAEVGAPRASCDLHRTLTIR